MSTSVVLHSRSEELAELDVHPFDVVLDPLPKFEGHTSYYTGVLICARALCHEFLDFLDKAVMDALVGTIVRVIVLDHEELFVLEVTHCIITEKF